MLLCCASLFLVGCSQDPGTGEGSAVPPRDDRGNADPGRTIFERACIACHGAGLVGAPKLGDKQAWAPRTAKGREVLIQHAIIGYSGESGVMPPKGGHTYLDDESVAAAVDYMLEGLR